MAHSYSPFDQEWFGYSKEQVMLLLLQYKNENRKKIDDMKLEIDQMQAQNSHLKKQYHCLKQQVDTYPEDQALYEYALQTWSEAVQAMKIGAEQKAQKMQEARITAAKSFNAQLEKLTLAILNNMESLQSLQAHHVIREEAPQPEPVPVAQKTAVPDLCDVPAKTAQEKAPATVSLLETAAHDSHTVPVKDDFWEIEPDAHLTHASDLRSDLDPVLESSFTPPLVVDVPKNPLSTKDSALHHKNQFLIGKFVGEDLLDQNGKTIAKKNAIITEDIIAKAEQSKKLADLIINMSASKISA